MQAFLTNPITHLMQLFNPNPNPNPNPRLLKNREDNKDSNLLTRLPSQVLVIILSKLDITTLCRCTAAAPDQISPLLHEIPSLSTPLPTSLFHPGPATASFHHRLLTLVLWKLLMPLSLTPLGPHLPRFIRRGAWTLVPRCFWHLCRSQKTILPSGCRFFRRLTGLESLEVELPPSPLIPNSWFRWEAEFGSKKFLIVAQAKIYTSQEQPQPPRGDRRLLGLRLLETGLRNVAYHGLTAMSLSASLLYNEDFKNKKKRKRGHDDGEYSMPNNNNEATRIKYVGRDMFGRIKMYADAKRDSHFSTKYRARRILCCDPNGILELNDGSIRVKGRVFFYFLAFFDEKDEAINYEVDDLIRAYLSGDVDDERKELREVVMKILESENKVVWERKFRNVSYQNISDIL